MSFLLQPASENGLSMGFSPTFCFAHHAATRHGVAAHGHHAASVGGRGGGAAGAAGKSRRGAAENEVGGAPKRREGWGGWHRLAVGRADPVGLPYRKWGNSEITHRKMGKL